MDQFIILQNCTIAISERLDDQALTISIIRVLNSNKYEYKSILVTIEGHASITIEKSDKELL